MKVAVIGGGSTYTPELVSGLAGLPVTELVLHDIDAERRDVVGGLAGRILDRTGFAGDLRLTGDLDAAVDGADFVLIQIRVGGQAARLRDETLPLACGCIGQETTGAGGFAKAMRTVPVVLDIAERVAERAAPGAWIVDFTNPVGIVTRALLDAGHRAVGLCNVAIGLQRHIARLLGVEPARALLDQVWYVDAPVDVLRRRLIERQLAGGRSEEDAARHVDESDLRNAELVARTRQLADLTVMSTPAEDSIRRGV